MRPTVFPANIQQTIDAMTARAACPYDIQLLRDLAEFKLQLKYDNIDLSNKDNRKWVAGNVAMCMGDYDDIPAPWAEGIKQEYSAIMTNMVKRPEWPVIYASLIQQITPEWREKVKKEIGEWVAFHRN